MKLGGFTVLSTVYRVRKCGGEKTQLFFSVDGDEWWRVAGVGGCIVLLIV